MDQTLPKNHALLSEEQRALWKTAYGRQRLDISLTNDFAFKTAFRNKKALRGLLSALLELEVEEIIDLEFPDPVLHSEYPEEKEGILDVKVLLNGNKKINLEIQVLPFAFWEERSLYYTAKYFVEGLEKGDDYEALNTTIHISILSFLLKDKPGLYRIYELRERKNQTLYSDKISLRVLQLKEIIRATEEEQKSKVYQWAKMISTKDWEVLRMMAEQNEYMKAAVDEIEKINTEEALRYRYLLREKRIRDEATVRKFEREAGLRQGIEQGIERGIKQGIEQGIERGIEQGETIKLISLVRRKMLKMVSPETIAEALEEAPETIQTIQLTIQQYPKCTDLEIFQALRGKIEPITTK